MTDDRPLLVISPHFDDAVLSTRRVLAARPGSIVATLFSEGPRDPSVRTRWDKEFASSDECVAERTLEDLAATRVLDAHQQLLGFPDGQYRIARDSTEMAMAVAACVQAAAMTHQPCGPLGMRHPDHVATAVAYLDAADRLGLAKMLVYEEVPYRVVDGHGDQREQGLERLTGRGWRLEPIALAEGDPHKAEDALQCYRSQLRVFADLFPQADPWASEAYWHATR